MLTYYPDDAIYIVGRPRDGLVTIDADSRAYAYCEYLRIKRGSSVVRDLDGDVYQIIAVSSYHAQQIKTFVELELSFRATMERGL